MKPNTQCWGRKRYWAIKHVTMLELKRVVCWIVVNKFFFHEMTILLKQEFWNKSFENQTTHTLDISKKLHGRGGVSCTKFVTIQKNNIYEIAWYKIIGISRSTYMSYKHKNKKRCKIWPHQNKGMQKQCIPVIHVESNIQSLIK